MIRPRRASGAASCSEVLQPIAVSVAVKPTTASSAPPARRRASRRAEEAGAGDTDGSGDQGRR